VTETLLNRPDFLGAWSLSRRIDDRLSGQTGVFEGTAQFTPQGDNGAHYAERGMLRLGDAPAMAAEREYFWDFRTDRIAVTFSDGREFIVFRPKGRDAEAVHLCDPDVYRVVHDFTGWPRWQAIWTVTGPRKDYRMRSVYDRP